MMMQIYIIHLGYIPDEPLLVLYQPKYDILDVIIVEKLISELQIPSDTRESESVSVSAVDVRVFVLLMK